MIQRFTVLDLAGKKLHYLFILGVQVQIKIYKWGYGMTILTNEQLTFLVIELDNRVKELESKGKRNVFKPPTSDEVMNYMNERGYQNYQEADKFCDFYASKGWLVGKTKMKDWKASVRQWITRNQNETVFSQNVPSPQVSEKQQVRAALRNVQGTDW